MWIFLSTSVTLEFKWTGMQTTMLLTFQMHSSLLTLSHLLKWQKPIIRKIIISRICPRNPGHATQSWFEQKKIFIYPNYTSQQLGKLERYPASVWFLFFILCSVAYFQDHAQTFTESKGVRPSKDRKPSKRGSFLIWVSSKVSNLQI